MLSRRGIGKLRICLRQAASSYTSETKSSKPPLKRTSLHAMHIRLGGKMVEFAGYSMPVQYKASIIDSHNHTRAKAGLFDVSHMLQLHVRGNDRKKLIDNLIVANVDELKDNQGTLSVFTNEKGGIMDDLIISRCHPEPYYYIVSNAGCADKIVPHLKKWIEDYQGRGFDVRFEVVEKSLLALQGPSMTKVLQPGIDFSLDELKFMHGRYCNVFGIPNCRVTRCGYTGEDGVEISVPNTHVEELASRLLDSPEVLPIGLGARDTLRLEAGLCLYGNDIDEETSPVEAALSWTISKDRVTGFVETGKFLGQDVIAEQMKKKGSVTRRRVGIMSTEGPPARNGAKIFDESGTSEIGIVTSGCISPYLRSNIGMGYVKKGFTKTGTPVQLEIRKKKYPASVTKMPFVPAKYFF